MSNVMIAALFRDVGHLVSDEDVSIDEKAKQPG